jgi:hypothetical protein
MSAFIVSQKTVNRIIDYIAWVSMKDPYMLRILSHAGYELPDSVNRLGQDMIKLNYGAVNERYGEEEKPEKFQRVRNVPASLIQTVKSLQCFLYQCTEGEQFENSKLYQCLRRLEEHLLNEIVTSLPAYGHAVWG